MSGRRVKYLTGAAKNGGLGLSRAERRRFTRAWLTPPEVLAAMHKALAQLERKRLNRAVARDKRRWNERNRAAEIRAERAEAV